MTPLETLALCGTALGAGVVNTLAGGGSLITVPLLVLLGLPGGVANGTNRVGVLLQSGVAAWRFRALGLVSQDVVHSGFLRGQWGCSTTPKPSKEIPE